MGEPPGREAAPPGMAGGSCQVESRGERSVALTALSFLMSCLVDAMPEGTYWFSTVEAAEWTDVRRRSREGLRPRRAFAGG